MHLCNCLGNDWFLYFPIHHFGRESVSGWLDDSRSRRNMVDHTNPGCGRSHRLVHPSEQNGKGLWHYFATLWNRYLVILDLLCGSSIGYHVHHSRVWPAWVIISSWRDRRGRRRRRHHRSNISWDFDLGAFGHWTIQLVSQCFTGRIWGYSGEHRRVCASDWSCIFPVDHYSCL